MRWRDLGKKWVLVFLGIVFALLLVELCSKAIGFSGAAPFMGSLYFLEKNSTHRAYTYELPTHVKNYPRFPIKDTESISGSLGQVNYFENDGEMFYGRKDIKDTLVFFKEVMPRPATVTIDSYRHRVTNNGEEKPRKRHLLFMGCSMVFGDGLTDANTFPWKLHHMQSEYDVYNLGFSAYNPALTYRMIDHYQWLNGVSIKPGYAIYILYPYQIERFKGLTHHLDPVGYPQYVFSSDGTMKFMGFKESLSGWKGILQRLYMGTEFYKTFRWSWPWITIEDYENMAHVLKKIEDQYAEKFGKSSHFLVVLPPYSYKPEELTALKNSLEGAQVAFMDLSQHNLSEYVEGTAKLPDGHMNERATSVFADMLWNEIQFLEREK